MMTKTIQVEIITPDNIVLKEDADFLVVPSSNGELGILPGHANVIASLTPGRVRLTKMGQTKFLVISGGFMQINPEKVVIFAETAQIWVNVAS